MDRDDLIDLFSPFGPITLKRMFSGYGIAAGGVNFAMSLRAGIILRVDEQTVGRFDAEGAKPFQYQTKSRTVVVNSYRHLPERLYDDPDELAIWAREAVGAAQRAKAKKPSKKRKLKGSTTKAVVKAKTAKDKPAAVKRKTLSRKTR
jgi:DNA transformation protein